MSLRILVFLLAFYAALPILQAQTLLNFETLNDGDVVTNQFSGVTFSNALALTAGFSLDEIEYPAHSGKNVISDTEGPLTVTFSSAISAFSGYFTHSKPITVTAFDGSGNQLATTSSSKNNAAISGDGTPPNELLALNGNNIAKVVITGDPAGDSVVADDLSYATGTLYTLSATPSNLTFNQALAAPPPPAQNVFVTISTSGVSIPYTATVSDPWIIVSGSGTSEQNLRVSVNPAGLNPGSYSGTITLTSPQAINGPLVISVTLAIGPVVNSLVNSASFVTGTVATGSIATIFGANLTAQTIDVTTLPLPTNLGGLSATVNGLPVAFYYASPSQVNMELPSGLPAGPAALVLDANGTMTTFTVQIAPVSPGLFLIGSYVAAINLPGGAINGANAGAAPGSYVEMFMTGAGDVSNAPGIGAAASASPLSFVNASVTATIGGQTLPVTFAGLTPGLVDLVQVNVQIPLGLTNGDYPIVVSVGGVPSNSGLLRVTNP